MKAASKITAFLFSTFILASSQSALAIGPEETSCSDDPKVPCVSQDPEVQSFRKKQIAQLYDELIYPGPIEVLKDSNNAGHIFEVAGVRGRVTPLGKFTDFTGVVEYFYALALNPSTRVFAIDTHTLLGDGDQVAVSVNLAFCENKIKDCEALDEKTKKKNTLNEQGFFKFNKANKVISFDLVIPNLSATYDVENKLERASRIAGVCAFLTVGHINPITQEQVKGGTCTSYFDSQDDFGKGFLAVPGLPFLNCMTFMGSMPYGSYARANSNSFTCR